MTRTIFAAFTLMAATLSAIPAAAHDFFLMPARFVSQTAGPVSLKASVSSRFPQPETVVTADRIAQLAAQGAGNPRLTIAGVGENALDLRLNARRRGLFVAGARTVPRDVDYPEDRIGIILEEYDVGPAALAAIDALPRPRTLQVSSRRYAKSILCVAACANRAAASRPFGFDLEFVADPARAAHFRLLGGNRALADHPVQLVMADGSRRHLRTDGNGLVHLPAEARGVMMLFAAAMHRPQENARFVLDLSSLTLSR